MKDLYREIAEQHKQPLEKIKEPAWAEGETLQRPMKGKAEKKRHYPLITVMLVFFVASPFLAVYAFTEEKPIINQMVTEKPDARQDETAQ